MSSNRTQRRSLAEDQEDSDPKTLAYIETDSNRGGLIINDGSHIEQRPSQSEKEAVHAGRPGLKWLDKPLEAGEYHRGLWLSQRTAILLGILTLISIMGLALGLGLGLTFRKTGDSEVPAGLPQSGALNGSGIVAIDLDDGMHMITTYTQTYDGTIVWSQYLNDTWSGGSLNDTVLTDNDTPRNGTPLMALSYINNEELIWHVFYVTTDNYLADSVNSNKSDGWSTGFLRNGNFAVSNSSHVGLSACVNYDWYGEPYNNGLGIRLYYGAANNTIQELGWALGNTAWDYHWNFPDTNGAGGVECTVRGSSITYIWLEANGNLQQMWYDFDVSARSPTHPVKEWVTGLTYSPILPNSSISAINNNTTDSKLVHFQDPNYDIKEIIANGTAENDTWSGTTFDVGSGIAWTRIGSVVLETGIGDGQEIHVMYQTNDTDMMDFTRTLDGGSWAPQYVPVGV